ncbi:MAG: hypothetical protein HY822_06885 [Acidobacteria bacterium]|nr:hypothetical protein [Acidobacteriota bacterium]
MGLAWAALFASAANGQAPAEQNLDRVLHFTRAATEQEFQELATVIRAVGEIRRISVDTAERSLALSGTPAQIELAEWLFNTLEQPGRAPAMREYRPAGAGDTAVRVFLLAPARTARELQEVATVVRSIGDIRWLFTYNPVKAVTLRGTSDQMALAEWLIHALESPDLREFRMPGNADDVVRVFYLAHAETPQRLQEIAVLVRKTIGIRRLFLYTAPRALAVRGTAEQMLSAERLIQEHDKPGASKDARE